MSSKAQLKVGDPIPSFELFDQQGNTFKSADHIGTPLVFFSIPKIIRLAAQLRLVALEIMRVNSQTQVHL